VKALFRAVCDYWNSVAQRPDPRNVFSYAQWEADRSFRRFATVVSVFAAVAGVLLLGFLGAR